MSEPLVEGAPGPRRSWREVCGLVGWISLGIAFLFALTIFWRMLGASVGLALGAGGMSADDADAIRRDVMIFVGGVGGIGVLSVLARRWVLLILALVLFAAGVFFLSGRITTG